MNPQLNSILRNSIIFNFIIFIVKAYGNSRLKGVVDKIVFWSRESSIFILWTRYMEVESTVEYSFTYRILSTIGKKLDRIAQRLNKIIIFIVRKSGTSRFLNSLVKETIERTYGVVIMALLGFIAGYALFVSMLNIWSLYRFAFLAIPLAAALILYSIEDNWKLWIKASILYRIFNYIFD